jgi:hypothetical protein
VSALFIGISDKRFSIKNNNHYIPIYFYQYLYLLVHTISKVWTEWSSGLNGHLPVRELEDRWGPRWRRNVPSQRTENG